ncbi:ROK family protein [Microbacterium koreense]
MDVGGTKTDAVLVDPAGTVGARVRLATGWGPDAVTSTVVEAVGRLATAAGVPMSAFSTVGVGIPGQVDPVVGAVSHAVNLGIDYLDLAGAAGRALELPVHVENDVKAAALGAAALHGGEGTMAYLNLGTGVAAGIVRDGELVRGTRGGAGEVGHISVDPNGPRCRCGQRGCIEALAGGGAVAERWAKPGAFPVRDVFDAADAGDPLAVRLRGDLAYGVASAVRVLVLTDDVDTVVLGGGVSTLGARLLEDVTEVLDRSAVESAFLRSLSLPQRLEILPAGSPAAALGAALVGDARDGVLFGP